MPIFEYVCEKCNHEFEALVYRNQEAECPKCQSRKLVPQLSVFAVASKSAFTRVANSASPAPCGSCGDARGPGACSMSDFD